MKYKALPLLPLAAALAACAGGVAEPHVPVSIPTATPLPAGEVTLSSDNGNIENINTAGAGSASDAPSRSRRSLDAAPQNTSGISIRQREVEKDYFGYKSKETSFIFKTPGGAQYALSSYADPITVSYSSPDFKIPDRHAGQRLADGSRIFICCSDSGATSYAEITKQDYMKFGAWIGPNGEIDLFAGGFPVGKTPPPAFSYGSSTPETALSKGKITYSGLGHPRQKRAICYFLLYAAEKRFLLWDTCQYPRPFLYHRQFQQQHTGRQNPRQQRLRAGCGYSKRNDYRSDLFRRCHVRREKRQIGRQVFWQVRQHPQQRSQHRRQNHL